MRFVLVILLGIASCFAACKELAGFGKEVLVADFWDGKIAYADIDSLHVRDLDSGKDILEFKFGNDKITAVAVIQNSVIAGFESGSLVYLENLSRLAKTQTLLLDPVKTRMSEPVSSVLRYGEKGDKIVLTLGSKKVATYDLINKIYKIHDINLGSKVISTALAGENLIVSCFDRRIYKINLNNGEKTLLVRAPQIVSALAVDGDKVAFSTIDGRLVINEKELKFESEIASLNLKNGLIIAGCANSNLKVLDANSNLKYDEKITHESIKKVFVYDGGALAISWGGEVVSCDLNDKQI